MKELILKTAYDLFAKHGYENVSVNRIIEKTGISKGGFYHHFNSKEEVLDLIAQRQVDAVLSLIVQLANDTSLSAIEKFNQLMERVQAFRSQDKEELFKLYEGYLHTKNNVLRDKLEAYTLEKALPVYVRIVKQGISEGVFHTSSPELAVETLIRVAPVLRMRMATCYIARNSLDDYEEQVRVLADYLEEFTVKILGAKPGILPISSHFKSYFLT